MSNIPINLLRQLLRHDPSTGQIFWLYRHPEMFKNGKGAKAWNTRYAGKTAFTSLTKEGRAHGSLKGKYYFRSRVIWALEHGFWPIGEIDHIDGNRMNDAVSNLRDVSPRRNMRNCKTPSHNKSGHIGVFWNTQKSKWAATIKVNRRNLHLGYFHKFEDACAARKSGEIKHDFHPNHGR